jgi:O-antigen/teichoic acid export membrane protein
MLTSQEYGFTRNLVTQSIVATPFIMMGLQSALVVYIHKYPPGDPRRKTFLTFCFFIPFLVSVLLSIPYFVFKEQAIHFYKPEDQGVAIRNWYLLPISSFFWSFMMVLEHYLGSQMKVAASAFTREVIFRIIQIAIIILYATGHISFDVFLGATILSVAVPVVLMYFMGLRTEGFGISFDFGVFSKGEYREIVHFAVYHLLTNFSLSLLGYVDALMLAPLDKTGTRAVAVYSPAVFLMSILVIPYRAIAASALAPIAASYEQKQLDRVSDMFERTAINGWIVAVGMMTIIIVNLQNAVRILPAEYSNLSQVALILLLGRMVDMLTGLNNEVLSISKHYQLLFWMTIGLVVMIIAFNWWLIPLYGVVGAATGTTMATTIFNIMKLIVVKAKLGLQPISKQTFLVLLAGFVAIIPGYLMPFLGNAIWDAAIRSIIVAVIFGLLMLLLKPSKDLHHFVGQIRSNKRLF